MSDLVVDADGVRIRIADVIEIARAADEEILKVYRDSNLWELEYKVGTQDGREPLTLADRKANEVICMGLKRIAPNIPIISEENENIPYEQRKNFRYFWCVDPLDGTKEFVKKNDQFTVNIGLCCGSNCIAGVVTIPCSKVVYWGVKGQGAYKCEEGKEKPERIFAQTFKRSDKNLTLIGSRSHNNETTERFLASFHSKETITKGSSLKFLLIAEGRAHVYPRMAPTSEWDTCASQIILEEAGGKLLQLTADGDETNNPLVYNKPNILNPYFVAYAALSD